MKKLFAVVLMLVGMVGGQTKSLEFTAHTYKPLQSLDAVLADRTYSTPNLSLINANGEIFAVISKDHTVTISKGHTSDEVILSLADEILREAKERR